MKNIVAIGGGHGLSVVLSGLKKIKDANISAIVTVADDGGSTGRLRKRYTIPAMGDIRNVMLSLSNSSSLMYDLMNYRFEGEDNKDIAGHSLGNLILTALTNMTGSFDEAIKEMSRVLNIKGKIIPSTLESVTLYAKLQDKKVIKGEAFISNKKSKIKNVFYDHEVKANKEAVEAIKSSDLIIYGIGSLYTSILPNLIINDIKKAINKSKAKKIYFANAMTQASETYNYKLSDYYNAFVTHKVDVDFIIKHNQIIPVDILTKYKKEDSIEVIDDIKTNKIIRRDLLDFSQGLVRHDSIKIKKVVEEFIK